MNSDLGVGELSTSRQPVVEHHKVAWYYQGLQLGNIEHSCIKWIDCVVPPGTFVVSPDASVNLLRVIVPEGIAIHMGCRDVQDVSIERA